MQDTTMKKNNIIILYKLRQNYFLLELQCYIAIKPDIIFIWNEDVILGFTVFIDLMLIRINIFLYTQIAFRSYFLLNVAEIAHTLNFYLFTYCNIKMVSLNLSCHDIYSL